MSAVVRAPTTVRRQRRQQLRTIWMAWGAVLVLAVLALGVMHLRAPETGLGLVLLAIVTLIAATRPAAGLGIAIVGVVAGDARSMPWWPGAKNLSSQESVLYLSNSLTISPYELVLATVLVVWILRRVLAIDTTPLEWGLLWRPLAVYSAGVAFGLVWGLSRGGDLRVAMFEVRPLICIPLVYVAATNLFTSMRHYRLLLWGLVAALSFETVYALANLSTIEQRVGEGLSPVEHTEALHLNLVLLFLVGSWWLGTRRPGTRPLLVVVAIPTLVLYLEAERRAAVIAFVIGAVFLAVVLLGRNRARFLMVIPVVAVVTIAYTGAFWGSQSQLGFPAQAIKTVIQPDTRSTDDASSDLYRQIESYDLWATIQSDPITGIGFGNQFLRPIPLPDISFFEFWAYMPHNSVLWMWTQVGVVGFLGFLYLFGLGVAVGMRASRRIADNDDACLVAVVAAYLPMTLVVAYVDITFDLQTTALLGLALALVGSAERLAGLPPVDETATHHHRSTAPDPARTLSSARTT